MTLDRQSKEALVERYSEGFAATANAFILGYKGISVPQATELRSKIREVGGSYEVVKNRLALLALEGSDMADLGKAGFQAEGGLLVGLAAVKDRPCKTPISSPP